MTAARQVLPDKTHLVTRVCVGRQHLLHGGRVVNATIEYLLALGCARFGLELCGYVFMSNHLHIVVHDPYGRLPQFTEFLHGLLARALNSVRGRRGAFWEAEQVNVAELADGEKVLDKIAYAMANPTRAGLVERGEDWIGPRSRPEDYLRPRTIERPNLPFFADGTLPESVELRLCVPPSHAHLTPEEFAAEVAARAEEKEAEARADVKRQGRRFLGPVRLRALDWRRAATTLQAHGAGRVIKPTVLASDKATRNAVLARIKLFRHEYAIARAAFRSGDTGVLFPAGTYHVVVHLGARAHPPP